jgi:transposase-like protein
MLREVDAGGSISDVARRHEVRPKTLAWWRWQLRRGKVARSAIKGSTTKASAVQMVPVRVRAKVQAVDPVDDVIEIAVRGAVVRIRVGQDARYVAELAAALASRC